MVFSATDLNGFESVMACDADDLGPEFGLEFVAQAFLPFFGAENHVDTHARMYATWVVPPGLNLKFDRLPSAEALG